MHPDYWPDGRPLSEIVADVEAGKAELRGEDVEPWPYDPRAVSGFAKDHGETFWNGPPALALVAGFLRSKHVREDLEEYLCDVLWDVDTTCPEGLQLELLRQAAELIDEAGRVVQVLEALSEGSPAERRLAYDRQDNQHTTVSSIRLRELADVLTGRGWDRRTGPPASRGGP